MMVINKSVIKIIVFMIVKHNTDHNYDIPSRRKWSCKIHLIIFVIVLIIIKVKFIMMSMQSKTHHHHYEAQMKFHQIWIRKEVLCQTYHHETQLSDKVSVPVPR